MQTLKTSAIVVLLMTVLYGAYVQMTTPPHALPPDVEKLVVDSGMLDIDSGIGDSFGGFDIDAGTIGDSSQWDGSLAANTQSDGSMTPNQMTPGQLDFNSATGFNAPNQDAGSSNGMTLGAIDQNFANPEQAPASFAQSETDSSFSLTDMDMSPQTNMSAVRLPMVSGVGAAIQPEAGLDYPSTGAGFELPDPLAAVSMAEESISIPGGASLTVDETESATSQVAAAGLQNAIATADRQYSDDRRREALATLSLFYETPNLDSQQREELLVRLDPLAREVIYSREHLLDEPHRVGPNETLMDIAQKYEVPWQLLANINGVSDPVTILPGKDLKVVRGPFRADVDLKNQELTLFLGDLYAGRFPIMIGKDPAPQPGAYTIQEKQSAKTYYDLSGTPIPPGNPRNPYGSMWIDLGSGLCIHGSPDPKNATDKGCISIAGNYSQDVLGILSEGSSVIIR